MTAIVGTIAASTAGAFAGTGGADEATVIRRQEPGEISLRLVGQRWAIAPGDPLRLEYEIDGRIEGVVPPTTTTTTSTTTTTTTEPRRTTTTRPGREPVTATTEQQPDPRPSRTDETQSTSLSEPTETTMAVPEGPIADVVVAVHQPIVGLGALTEALDVIPPDVVDVVRLPLSDVLGRATGSDSTSTPMTITVPTTAAIVEDDSLTMGGAGLVPVSVYVSVDGQLAATHTTVVQRVDDLDVAPSIAVAVVAGTGAVGPQPDAEEVANGRDDLEAMADLGEAVDAPITLSIPPNLAAAAIADDPQLGDRLRSVLAGDEALSLPAYELDPSAVVPVDPARLTSLVADGEDVLDGLLPSTPAQRSAWIVDRPLSQRAAQALRDLGFRLLVIDEAMYTTLPGNIGGYIDATLVIDATIGADATLPALVTSSWATLLDPTRPADDPRSPADRAVRVMAELLTLRDDFDPAMQRAAVLSTPDLGVPDPAVIGLLADFVDESPNLRAVTLSALPGATTSFDVAGETVTVELPVDAGVDLAPRAAAIAETRFGAADVGSMLRSQDPRPSEWSERLDTLLSTALADTEVSAELARIDAEVTAIRDAVIPPTPFTFTLTGRSDELRLRIGNQADVPLRVVVRAVSPKLTFTAENPVVTVAAGELTNVELPVRARSNGTSSVTVQLLTPSGGQVGEPVTLTVHVTALAGLGQVITGGAVLMLLTWWGSHVRRSRLRRRATNGTAPDLAARLDALSPDAAEASGAHSPTDNVLDP